MQRENEVIGNRFGEDKSEEQQRVAEEALRRARAQNSHLPTDTNDDLNPGSALVESAVSGFETGQKLADPEDAAETTRDSINWASDPPRITTAIGERPFTAELAAVAGLSPSLKRSHAVEPGLRDAGPGGRLTSSPDGRSPGAISGVDGIAAVTPIGGQR